MNRRVGAVILLAVFFFAGVPVLSQDEPAPGGDTPTTTEKPAPTTTPPRKKKVPRKRPAKKRPDGIADDFPVYPEKLVPGTRNPDNIVLPHLKGGTAPEPPKKVEPKPTPVKKDPVVKPPKKDDGPGFWASLMNRIRNDQKFINILVLAILVAIFVIYRIRAGRSVRRKF